MSQPKRPNGRITLSDVAREAGVSVQTASHVLSDNQTVRVPESTRERVREAAKKVGYRPNRLAQAMRRGKTNVIAVWMPLDRAPMSYLRMLNQFFRHARTAGYELMVVGIDSLEGYSEFSGASSHWPVDGLISIDAGRAMQTFRQLPGNGDVPICILGAETVENGDTVTWRLAGGAMSVVERMIALGRKRIAYVAPQWILDEFPLEQRRRGYTEAMMAASLETIVIGAEKESVMGGESAMDAYIATHGAPDGIFAFTDPLAIGAMRSLQKHGTTFPDDCDVWGFGDFVEGQDIHCPLSTLRQPLDLIVDQAWKWLFERLESSAIESRIVELDLEFVVRSSGR